MDQSNKYIYIEFLRIVAAFLVIVNHTNSNIFLARAPSATWFASVTYFFICKIAVPLFLMIMGALLLEKHDTPRKSAQRFFRIFLVFFIGSLGYYLYYGRDALDTLSFGEFLCKFFSGRPLTNAYWYFYLYLALLCTLPLLQSFASALSKRQLQWLLFLSLGVLGVCPMFNLLLGRPIALLSADGLIGPYFGMVFAGYYIEHHMEITRRKCTVAGVLFVLLIAFQVIVTYLLFQVDTTNYYRLDNRTLLPITLSACCAYVMAKYFFAHVRCPQWLCRGIVRVGGLTFGVYLFSDLMISVLAPWLKFLNGRFHVILAMVIWEVCIFLVCALLTAVLHLIPVLRKYL